MNSVLKSKMSLQLRMKRAVWCLFILWSSAVQRTCSLPCLSASGLALCFNHAEIVKVFVKLCPKTPDGTATAEKSPSNWYTRSPPRPSSLCRPAVHSRPTPGAGRSSTDWVLAPVGNKIKKLTKIHLSQKIPLKEVPVKFFHCKYTKKQTAHIH